MRKVIVSLTTRPSRDYEIQVGSGLVEKLASVFDFNGYSRAFVITDDRVEPVLTRLMNALPLETDRLVLPAGEAAKTIDSVQAIWQAMLAAGCDRKSIVVNLGGGVIGDLGGFAAATYMRGLEFINLPTTLLAQVDASVGGKTGFNLGGIKNLIGSFAQPAAVIIDTDVLRALPDREFAAGFAEVIKHGLIKDRAYFEQVTAKPPRQFTTDELIDIIARSCELKAAVVQADEIEAGQRKLLNFGHTIGHAVEAVSLESATPLLHGEAISIGMAAESHLAQLLGLLSAEDVATIRQSLRAAGLPVNFRGDNQTLRQKMTADKKNQAGQINFTLIDAIGHGIYNESAPDELLNEVLKALA